MRLGLDWSWDWGCGDSWPGARALTLRRGSLPLPASVAGARPIEVQPLALRLGTSLEFERSSWRAVSVPFWATEGCKNKVPAIRSNRLPVPLQAPEVVGVVVLAREARATSLACAVDHLGRRGGSLSGIVWL